MTDAPMRIDVHFHAIPAFYREAAAAAGRGPTTSRGFPAWTPELALALMDQNGIATAITSISQPGVHFGDDVKARKLARQCNEHAAELIRRWPRRFGAFAALPMPDVAGAKAEVLHALDVLKLDGIGLLASYGERFLGDPAYDPVLALLNEREAVVFIHPNYHPSSRALGLKLPGFLVEFLFDTTRAAVNLIFSGAIERFPRIRFILAHAGGTLPFIAWRLAAAPSIDPQFALTPERIRAGIRHFWYDTALSAGQANFGALDAVADPSRILFGSDWPFAPEAITRETVASIERPGTLGPAQQRAVDRENALALFPRLKSS